MDRSELQATRSRLTDDLSIDPGELREIALRLLDEVTRERLRESLLRADYADLLEASRAAVAATWQGCPDPTAPLEHRLRRLGLLPPLGMPPGQALADAASLCTVLRGTP
ncbi:unnamed protein product [[Actinomadura] parvosata subsp. kistnae]|uniref:Uncharacterized protein n=2 Tax=Nonomuraea TaxID=83681 RepID=A0A1U9ZWR7_9ACTN|nr:MULTISPECIES: hypothetical protein [unclassified Nonomuraea]AQZ62395.1 hypothetical protein BKM31_13805 [Nonomuraea sp. ATCC 55076]NJP96255.1 hypothetical protein [Nonomuraea sp. FMUSA5-5]SPL88605.1 unnamed protein product [Actinomadura parvosata subsp. kistnae]